MHRDHRRELKRDKFVDEMGSLTSRARENQRLLVGLTVTVVVLALIGYGIYFYRSNRERQAQEALAAAIETIDSPLIEPGVPNPKATFRTDQERTTRATVMFHDLQKKYGGTDASDVANLYLARLDATTNDVAGAKKLLEQFIKEHPDHILVGGAKYSLYELRIGNGEATKVVAELNQEMGKKNERALPGDVLLVLLAHAYEAQGNLQESKETYRRIVNQFPDSPYAIDAQRRVGSAT